MVHIPVIIILSVSPALTFPVRFKHLARTCSGVSLKQKRCMSSPLLLVTPCS